MGSVYALLVAIDAYSPPVRRLAGCKRDIDRVRTHLTSVVDPDRLLVKELCDEQATRAAIIDGFRTHLRRASSGDTALFWFSGHGSLAPVWPEYQTIEPTKTMQTLVAVDSRLGGAAGDLLDKEIDILIRNVAAQRAHVVAVFDCCHARGMTRAALAARHCYPLAAPPPLDQVLPELRHRFRDSHAGSTRPADHVALYACATREAAHEIENENGQVQGAFTAALIAELARAGTVPTYRELIAAARCHVQNRVPGQAPYAFPSTGPLADQPFLGGAARPAGSPIRLRWHRGDWEINVGAIHGFAGGTPHDPAIVAVHGIAPPRTAVVREVHTSHSLVRPTGWEPDNRRQYEMVLARTPLPTAGVRLGDSAADQLVRLALRNSSLAREAAPGVPVSLQVATADGAATLLGADGSRLMAGRWPLLTQVDAGRIVRAIEHIAKWQRIRGLRNPSSRLAEAVSIELVLPHGSHPDAWAAQPALRPDETGAISLDYRHGDGWVAPELRVRLRNRTGRSLYCVLLDLTDQYRVHPLLFPGDEIAPYGLGWADEGRPIEFRLPASRPPEPGQKVTDWLMVLVSEAEFSSEPFYLGPLLAGAPDPTAGSTGGAARSSIGLRGVLDRIGAAAVSRDADITPAPAQDWATSTTTVITKVPKAG